MRMVIESSLPSMLILLVIFFVMLFVSIRFGGLAELSQTQTISFSVYNDLYQMCKYAHCSGPKYCCSNTQFECHLRLFIV